ncbi:MAG: hypothetical protein ACFNKE_11165, partial [Neisseria elongata]
DAGMQYAAKADHGGGTVGFIQSIIPDTLFSVLRRNGSRPELRHMPPAVTDLAELYEVREWITP